MSARRVASIVLGLVLVFACSRRAGAATIELRDAPTGFRIELDSGDAVLCSIRPELAAPTKVCATVAERMDLDKLKSAFAVVAIVHGDWTLAVVANRTASVSKNRPTDDQVALVASGIESYFV